MKIENKKLAKEFKNIIASSEKAKKVIVSELDKIDAKYKALAEKEKAELNDALKNLDAMIAVYAPMFEQEAVSEETVDDSLPFDEIVSEDANDEAVVEEPEAEEAAETVVEDEAPEFDGAGFTDNDSVQEPEEELEDLPEDDEEKSEDSDDDWGSFPKEW